MACQRLYPLAATSPEANVRTMPATKERRTPDDSSKPPPAYYLYPHKKQSTFFEVEGRNEERSALINIKAPNTHGEEEATTHQEGGQKASQDPEEGEGMRHPHLVSLHYHVFSPPHAQLHFSPVSYYHPQQNHKRSGDNLLPSTAAYSPLRCYASPGSTPTTHLKKDHPPSAIVTGETKAKSNGRGDFEDLSPTLPNLLVEVGIEGFGTTSSPRHYNSSWDRRFHELVSLHLITIVAHNTSFFIVCSILPPFSA